MPVSLLVVFFFVVGTFCSAGCLDVYITVALLNKMLQTIENVDHVIWLTKQNDFYVFLVHVENGAQDMVTMTLGSAGTWW